MDGLTAGYFVAFVAGAGFAVVSWLLGALQGHGDGGGHEGGADGAEADADADLDVGGRGGGLLGAPAVSHAHAVALAHGATRGPGHLAHGHGHHGHGHGHGHHGLALRLVSPLLNLSALSGLACVGGGVGLIARRAGAGPAISLIAAIPSGLAAAYLIGGLVQWLRRGTRYKQATALGGSLAKVLAPVSDSRLGEIMYDNDGARATLPARGTKEAVLAPGTEVVILDVKDGVARVAAAAELLGLEPSPAAEPGRQAGTEPAAAPARPQPHGDKERGQ